jgi:hypothetical protein
MIGTTGVALDFIYQGIAKNRISLAPLSATQALLQDGKIPIKNHQCLLSHLQLNNQCRCSRLYYVNKPLSLQFHYI